MLLAGKPALSREPPHFSQEVPWAGEFSGAIHRVRLQAVVFPEFVFAGSFEAVLDHLRNEFRKRSSHSGPLGHLVLKGSTGQPQRLDLRLRGRNTLEIIDYLCALCGYNWTLAPHAIVIDRHEIIKKENSFFHELPPSEDPSVPPAPAHGGMTLREWYAATVFPEFKYSGTLGGAIEHLMLESRKLSPTRQMAGGFVVRSGDVEPSIEGRKVILDLKGRNALEIIDAICGETKSTWMFGKYQITILDAAVTREERLAK